MTIRRRVARIGEIAFLDISILFKLEFTSLLPFVCSEII